MNKERRMEINTYIQTKGEIKFNELISIFPSVSAMTLRRDLAYLEDEHKIIRTRGGAKSLSFVSENLKEEKFLKNTLVNIEEKNIIARKAVRLIRPGRSVFLDAGSTILCLSKLIPDERYYIFTSAPNVAMEVLYSTSSAVNLTGGELNRDNLAVAGAGAVDFMKNVNIDIAFMAVPGFSENNGFSCADINDSQLKKAIIEKAEKVVMLMDSSKIGINMPYTYARLSDVDIIVGDGNLPDSFLEEAYKNNVEVL